MANLRFGHGLPGDDDLRLCGDVSDGRRAVELGISDLYNATAFAAAGAKAIAVDPDPDRIAETRRRAAAAEVAVQCFTTDLADLGDIGSASCDVVLAVDTLGAVDDLSRLLRQAHRILKPGLPLVIALAHPYAAASAEHPYGSSARTVGEWFTALTRANFRVDQLIELGAGTVHDGAVTPGPTRLILRSHKEGS